MRSDRFEKSKPNIMRRFSQSLQEEMEQQLRLIHSHDSEPLSQFIEAIKTMVEVVERLKTFSLQYDFADAQEEIFFFREIKPRFAAKLIYYNELYNIEISKPVGDGKVARRHYKSEMTKLKSFFADNLDFYRYYRSGATDMDARYFIRRKADFRTTLDSAYFQADHRFSTSHDYKLACLLAHEELCAYLERCLNGGMATAGTSGRKPVAGATWTGSKVALVELVYALHAQGVFNNGNLALKDIVGIFEQLCNVSLGQYHKTFLEIRERKSERARFLLSLRDTFMERMERIDGL